MEAIDTGNLRSGARKFCQTEFAIPRAAQLIDAGDHPGQGIGECLKAVRTSRIVELEVCSTACFVSWYDDRVATTEYTNGLRHENPTDKVLVPQALDPRNNSCEYQGGMDMGQFYSPCAES